MPPNAQSTGRVPPRQDSRERAHPNISTDFQIEDDIPVPVIFSDVHSSIISQITVAELNDLKSEQTLSNDVTDREFRRAPVIQEVPDENTSQTPTYRQEFGALHPDEMDALKTKLLLRLSELKSSFTSVKSSFTSTASKKSVFSEDFTMTGLYLEDESCAPKRASRVDKCKSTCATIEENETSAMIRSICRDRNNYNLLMSAVLSMSERTGATASLSCFSTSLSREQTEQGSFRYEEEIEEEGNGVEDDDESITSFSVDHQLENFMASFAESSTSSLTKTINCHVAESTQPKRSRSSELLGSLAAIFSRKAKSNVEQQSDDTSPKGFNVEPNHRRDSLDRYLASQEFATGFSEWMSKVER